MGQTVHPYTVLTYFTGSIITHNYSPVHEQTTPFGWKTWWQVVYRLFKPLPIPTTHNLDYSIIILPERFGPGSSLPVWNQPAAAWTEICHPVSRSLRFSISLCVVRVWCGDKILWKTKIIINRASLPFCAKSETLSPFAKSCTMSGGSRFSYFYMYFRFVCMLPQHPSLT